MTGRGASSGAEPAPDRACRPRDVLLVTKPLAPPWTDGAKNLARDQVQAASGRYRYRCLVPAGQSAPLGAVSEPIYRSPGRYAPALRQNLRVLARLARPDAVPLYHFFFAPNPRTSTAAALIFRFKHRRLLHTVVSEPAPGTPWFAHAHIALTEATARRLRAAGAPNVLVVRPGIPAAPPIDRAAARARLGLPPGGLLALFAGDLVEGGGADVLAAALAPGVFPVFACRPKGHGHAERAERLAARLGDRGRLLGEVDDMASLVAAADVHVLPATRFHAKMDLPMVLLEGLRAGAPVVVADVDPVRELGGEADGVIRVPAADPGALRAALLGLRDPARRGALGHAARAAALSRWSAGRMARDVEALYDTLP